MAIPAAVESFSFAKIRLILFRGGLVMSIVCSFMVFSSWFNPFPLLPDGHGGYSNFRNSLLFDAGLFTPFLTIGLAIFGLTCPR